jgi:transcriptional regulator of arginine metabolism
MDKEKRQQKLLSLIRAKPVSTQGELASHLERAGFAATQSSISRDLEELGVVKRRGRYVVVEIDGAAVKEIVGTLAGEDTIFIAVAERKAQRAVIKKIWELFG